MSIRNLSHTKHHTLIYPFVYRDRSIGLEKRSDLTGRLIRLLNSTYLAGSATAAGKFLFAVCKQDRKLIRMTILFAVKLIHYVVPKT